MAISVPSSYSKYGKYLKKSSLLPTPQRQAYLEIVLSLFAVIFFGWFALRPTLITIGELLGEIDSRKEIAAQLDKKIDALAAARTTYEAASSQLALLDESLPPDLQVAEFTAQMEVIGLEAGLQITNFSFDSFALDKVNSPSLQAVPVTRPAPSPQSDPSAPTPPTWKSLPFQLTATGTYTQLRQLVAQLHGLRRVVMLDSLNLGTNATSGQEQLTLHLTGRIAYL